MAKTDATGAITAINSNPLTGTPSANSTVGLSLVGDYDTATVQVVGTYTGALTVQVSVNGTNWVSLGGTTALVNVATAGPAANIASGTQGIFQFDVSGFQAVRVTALAAVTGTANVTLAAGQGGGVIGIDTPIVIGAGSATIGTVIATTPSGANITVVSAATTNASVQKATAGNLFEVTVSNPTATPVYIKFYNKASAPTVGTDIPVMTITAPAASATNKPTDCVLTFAQIGKRFATGIAMAITGGPLATDTTVAVAGVQVHGTYI